MEASPIRQYVHLHIIVILLGFTAILGALISIPATDLVWYRMFLAFGGLGVLFYIKKTPFKLSLRKQFPLYAIGVVVALHWITFFHAIKVSNISVTLGVFASATLFTSILEPILQKRRIFWLEVLIGIVILTGVYIIFRYEFHYLEGIIFSLISAVLNGLFAVLNRNISNKHHPTVISFYEMLGGFVFITAYFGITGAFSSQLFQLSGMDIVYLLLLGLLCTSYAFTALVHIMKTLSAYTVVLAISLEPVYGIVLAYLFFPSTERMSPEFYFGALIIMSAVISYPWLKKKFLKDVGGQVFSESDE
jgi:drug/metabolite transporter (DMT)-like permease